MHSPVSVVTIVKSRTEKLCRLIEQLESCNPLPDELVIVWMCSPSTLSLAKSKYQRRIHIFIKLKAMNEVVDVRQDVGIIRVASKIIILLYSDFTLV